MIEVKINDGSFAYDVHSLIQAFYPGIEIQVREKKEFDGCRDTAFALSINADDIVFTIYEDGCVVRTASKGDTGKYPRREVKNELKRLIYRELSSYTGRRLPWGSLTGIRPVKIAMSMLDEGRSPEEIAAYMRDTYYCSGRKSALAISIAGREKRLLEGIDYQGGYSLYVGIPFCPSICLYCSFSSSPIAKWEPKVDAYLDALEKELGFISAANSGRRLCTVYIGGGTPTTLNPARLHRLLSFIEEHFDLSGICEYTVEAGRPDSVDAEKLKVLKAHDVSRISVNPQSMNQKTLDLIGRLHTVEETKEAFYLARDEGFDNINMDLIAGLPGEGLEEVRHTMEEIKTLDPDDITVHSLAVKRAARLKLFRDEYEEIGIRNSDEIMDLTALYCHEMGAEPYYLYRQKNMAGNFENVGYAKSGKAGLYNILMMEEKQDIMAAGAGASTKFVFAADHIERVENVKNVEQYIGRIDEMIARKSSFMEAHGLYD